MDLTFERTSFTIVLSLKTRAFVLADQKATGYVVRNSQSIDWRLTSWGGDTLRNR